MQGVSEEQAIMNGLWRTAHLSSIAHTMEQSNSQYNQSLENNHWQQGSGVLCTHLYRPSDKSGRNDLYEEQDS
eukprot:10055033-Ditylum_brightwellii.AAC.2